MHRLELHMRINEPVVRVLGSLSHFAIRYPWRVLMIAGLAALGAVPGLWRLRLRTDGHALDRKSVV